MQTVQTIDAPPLPLWMQRCIEAAEAYAAEKAAQTPKRTNRFNRTEELKLFSCFYKRDLEDASRDGRQSILTKMEGKLKREVVLRDTPGSQYNRRRHERMLNAFKLERLAFEAVTDTRWEMAA